MTSQHPAGHETILQTVRMQPKTGPRDGVGTRLQVAICECFQTALLKVVWAKTISFVPSRHLRPLEHQVVSTILQPDLIFPCR